MIARYAWFAYVLSGAGMALGGVGLAAHAWISGPLAALSSVVLLFVTLSAERRCALDELDRIMRARR